MSPRAEWSEFSDLPAEYFAILNLRFSDLRAWWLSPIASAWAEDLAAAQDHEARPWFQAAAERRREGAFA